MPPRPRRGALIDGPSSLDNMPGRGALHAAIALSCQRPRRPTAISTRASFCHADQQKAVAAERSATMPLPRRAGRICPRQPGSAFPAIRPERANSLSSACDGQKLCQLHRPRLCPAMFDRPMPANAALKPPGTATTPQGRHRAAARPHPLHSGQARHVSVLRPLKRLGHHGHGRQGEHLQRRLEIPTRCRRPTTSCNRRDSTWPGHRHPGFQLFWRRPSRRWLYRRRYQRLAEAE
jgi:hypothetical protein